MITTYFLFAYATFALAFFVHAVHGLWTHDRARRRERLLGLEQYILMTAVALVASAGWAALLPIAAAGRTRLAYERNVRPVLTRMVHWRGPRVAQRAV